MRFEFEDHLGAVTRIVSELERDGKPARNVTLERSYDATTDDLWDAITNPERLSRWFLPIGGELKLGGRWQLEGSAGGIITDCVPPRFFATTWAFGGETSWIEARIAPEGETWCRLSLSHICPVNDHWQKYGPGAPGVGWDLGLVSLAVHLSDTGFECFDEDAFTSSAEGKALIASVSEDWRRAAVAGGESPAQADAAAKLTRAFYIGEESEQG
ncbi:polyketide cyclase [Phyllobacterium salinisoli]|uniref:Polyketide cyclase n=1 Tax=Phyllobacterium salinisoli TaxID=1899321 RepID=A0A368K0R9_9HYPH|nr:SRPBCC family protein [Phyllobacterium salinisoli]RCS22821.1 polyketide cyclase [Phyllobacterium salinisoli]